MSLTRQPYRSAFTSRIARSASLLPTRFVRDASDSGHRSQFVERGFGPPELQIRRVKDTVSSHYESSDLQTRRPKRNLPVRDRRSNTRIYRGQSTNSPYSETNSRHREPLSSRAPRHRTTFRPTPASEGENGFEEASFESETPSFLQQKARSVINRRAEAASLTSMTNAEKAAFDNIWKLFEPAASAPTPAEQKHVDQQDTDFRNLLELFESLTQSKGQGQNSTTASHIDNLDLEGASSKYKFSGAHELGARSLDDSSQGVVSGLPPATSSERGERRSPEADHIDSTAHALVEDISSSFDAALQPATPDPELAMWEVCKEKIFPLTKLLIPSQSKMMRDHPPTTKNEPEQAAPKHPLISSHIPLIPLLSKVYPATLLLALRLFKREYPTSPYCLALLPHIKSLGPTSYVLGANTHFYNTLLSIRWDFYSDLEETSQLLAEMDRMGLEYDTGTADLLKRIAQERDRDLRDEPYEFIATSEHERFLIVPRERGAEWWHTPLVERSWNRLQSWRSIVTRRLEAQGLGEVMREDGQFVSFVDDTIEPSGSWSSRSDRATYERV